MNERDSRCRRPELQGSVMSKAVSIYSTERLVDLKLDDKGISFFKAETVKKVAEILTSENVDIALRKSAAEQLAVITQDITMHSVVKEQKVVETIRNVLQKCVHQDGQAFECMVCPCLTLLRKLVYADPVVRLTLAQEPDFLLTLFRGHKVHPVACLHLACLSQYLEGLTFLSLQALIMQLVHTPCPLLYPRNG
ncbi:hypothetical protein AB205_0018790 [Aquarana catesbeiana]|uniref:TATA-binding protein interacting (TIP20) domain-containing protein n=1 Tax=Aquarana catesbeiana TaxID=8400 RepID=A0A2G9SDF3_AQUCT|nr:hypothetical protein AB205_0018790 [Aquarana catesbeiana]